MDGWVRVLGFTSLQQYFSHFETMEGWTWKALCNEANPRSRDLKSGALTARPRGRFTTNEILDFSKKILCLCVNIPAHPLSWNSRLLKVQKHDNKQNFDYVLTINLFFHKYSLNCMALFYCHYLRQFFFHKYSLKCTALFLDIYNVFNFNFLTENGWHV